MMEKIKIDQPKKRVPINTTVDPDTKNRFIKKVKKDGHKPGRVLDVLMRRYCEGEEEK